MKTFQTFAGWSAQARHETAAIVGKLRNKIVVKGDDDTSKLIQASYEEWAQSLFDIVMGDPHRESDFTDTQIAALRMLADTTLSRAKQTKPEQPVAPSAPAAPPATALKGKPLVAPSTAPRNPLVAQLDAMDRNGPEY